MTIESEDFDQQLLTIEEFARLPDDGWRHELVKGRVVREPYSGFQQGATAANVGYVLHQFIGPRDLGRLVLGTGFVLWDEPPTVRGPDVAFVPHSRLNFDHAGFVPFAPDLAIEVLAPSNTMSEMPTRFSIIWMPDRSSCGSSIRSRRQ